MLVLTRKPGERVIIGDDIVVTFLEARGDSIRIGIEAPSGVRIQRDEIVQAVTESNRDAVGTDQATEDRIKAALGYLPGAPEDGSPRG